MSLNLVFNQISRTSKARYVSWHETCKRKGRYGIPLKERNSME